MDNTVVALITASKLDHREILGARLLLAVNTDEHKSLEVFAEDFDKKAAKPLGAEAGLRKGLMLFLLQNHAKADEVLAKENSAAGMLYHAMNLLSLDKRTQAGKRLQRLAEHVKKDTDQGLVFCAAKLACDLRDAKLAAEFHAKFKPDNAGYWTEYIQALRLELDGDIQGAVNGLETLAPQAHPLKPYTLFHFARLLDLRGFDDEALLAYDQIEALGYDFEEAMINKGLLLEDKSDFAKALRCYERALKINPRNKRALLYHSDAEASLNMEYDERKMKQDMKTSEILAIPISDFELSVRSRNCLAKMNIFTLKDLITKTEQELLSYKNFGETSLKEIRAMLNKKGLHLGMTRVEEQPLADTIKLNAQLFNAEKSFQHDQMDTTIEELNLSYRTKSALHKMGFESLRDITMRTGRDLEANPDLSPACLQEINALLREKGLFYRPETTPVRSDLDGDGSSLLDDEDGDPLPAEELVAESESSKEDGHYGDE